MPIESIGPVEHRTSIDEPLETAPPPLPESDGAGEAEQAADAVPAEESPVEDPMAAVGRAVNDEIAAAERREGEGGAETPAAADVPAAEPVPEEVEPSIEEQQVFVAPRPPDDPGPEPIDVEDKVEEDAYPAPKP